MRVLVTGGAGYIGSTATAMLIEKGVQVTVLDDLSTGHRESVHPDARFVEGSITEKGACHQALSGVDAVMHFAAKSLVGESVEQPEKYWSTNVMGTRTLLNQMREFGVKKLINSSSAATYGASEQTPIPEDAVTKPTNTYGSTKLAIEMMITNEAAAFGLQAMSLRYFKVAGAIKSESMLLGDGAGWLAERHSPETHLIPNILKETTSNPIKIFGRDWPTFDGTCIRDYIHVGDLIKAHLLALEFVNSSEKSTTGFHHIVNVGSGVGYSVQQVIDAATEVLNIQIPTQDTHRRAGDPATLVADITRAKELLNWEPEHDIKEMISDAHHAIQSMGNSKKK